MTLRDDPLKSLEFDVLEFEIAEGESKFGGQTPGAVDWAGVVGGNLVLVGMALGHGGIGVASRGWG